MIVNFAPGIVQAFVGLGVALRMWRLRVQNPNLGPCWLQFYNFVIIKPIKD